MKKRWLILPFLTFALILVLTLLPVSFISANPGNLVENSGFSDGLVPPWDSDGHVSVIDIGGSHSEVAYVIGDNIAGEDGYWEGLWQQIHTSNKNLYFSFDWNLLNYWANGEDPGLDVGFNLYDGGTNIGYAEFWWQDSPGWNHDGESIKDMYYDYNVSSLPDFDLIEIWLGTWYAAEAYFDNVKLTTEEEAAEEPVWVRTQEMTCNHVWVNEDNKFQFSFIYPYKDNNWVRIYDMAGKLVYEIDMPYDNPNIIVDLPDGMYTVKTFNDQPEPIQTFIIGKP
jgi:hypothetical protein